MTPKPIAESLHDDLHRIPGMPAHETAAANHARTHASHKNPSRSNDDRNHGDPTVLVGWQQRVARFFGAGAKP